MSRSADHARSKTRVIIHRIAALMSSGLLLALQHNALAADQFGVMASWAPPEVAQVRVHVQSWLVDQSATERQTQRVADMWPEEENEAAPDVVLDRLAATIAQIHPEGRQLVALFNQPSRIDVENAEVENAKQAIRWLNDEKRAPLVANNLKLLHAGWLCRLGFYDECLTAVQGLTKDDVVDPAALLFYRAVAHQRLVQPEESRENAVRLLERRAEIPRRYEQLALLIEADLKGLKHDSLDHIARRMGDIERRLGLGRAGKRVRDIEDGVIKSLDKLIEEEEKKQQQQQQQESGGNRPDSSRPMQDSRIAGGRGEGKIDRKKIGNRSGWGDLPPKQRDEALQQIGREYPAHYREIVEQYLKRLATEGTTKNN